MKKDWEKNRIWSDLNKAVDQLKKDELKKDELPRTQQYALRAALFRGPKAAKRQLRLIKHRYDGFDWSSITCGESLFFPEKGDNRICRLLDALELADLGSGGSS